MVCVCVCVCEVSYVCIRELRCVYLHLHKYQAHKIYETYVHSYKMYVRKHQQHMGIRI